MTSPGLLASRDALADVVAILVTPFTDDDTIDTKAHRALLRRLIDGGVRTRLRLPRPPRRGPRPVRELKLIAPAGSRTPDRVIT